MQYVYATIECIMAEIQEMYDIEFGESDDDLEIIHLDRISNPT